MSTDNRYPLGAQYSVCGASSLAGIAHELQNASHRSLTLSARKNKSIIKG